jgi:hypothetical protein
MIDPATPPADAATEALIVAMSDAETAARVLNEIARRTGHVGFSKAAGMLRCQSPGGRPRKDDNAALDQMAALIRAGTASTILQAARFVSRTIQGEISSDTAADRLAKKFRLATAKTQ